MNSAASGNGMIVKSALGRVLPSNVRAEANVIGACLVSVEIIPEIIAINRPDHFLDDAHRLIADAVFALDATGTPVDSTTVADWMKARGTLDRAGGAVFVDGLRDGVHDFENVMAHAEIVRDTARLRGVAAEAQKIAAESLAIPTDRQGFLDGVSARMERVASGANGDMEGADSATVLQSIVAQWANPTTDATIGTGIRGLDELLGGLRPGQLVTVGAHSGIGKTALVAGIADHVAVDEMADGKRCGVAVFTLEMTKEEYMERLLSTRSGINNRRFHPTRRGYILGEELARLNRAHTSLSHAPLRIFDASDVTPSRIRAQCRRLASRFNQNETPLRLVVVDYCQILAPDTDSARRKDSREQEVAGMARTLKKMAAELKVCVILLSQLNEDARSNNRAPRAHDLRESRGILNDSNAVILIDNPGYDDRAEGDLVASFEVDQVECVNIIVDKARHGAVKGTVRAAYRPGCTRFEQWDHATMGEHTGKRVKADHGAKKGQR